MAGEITEHKSFAHSLNGWEAKVVETPKENLDLTNYGGKPEIVRQVQIALPPKQKGVELPSNEQIWATHRGHVLSMLWKDGWEMTEEPKMMRKGKVLHVFVHAEMQKGWSINERPQSLKEIVQQNVKSTKPK